MQFIVGSIRLCLATCQIVEV